MTEQFATAPVFSALPTDVADAIWRGGLDANGQTPERAISSGQGVPCRHCLRQVPKGAAFLILALRPFPHAQPYAEVGPIFLCAEPCVRWKGEGAPEMLAGYPSLLLRGYDANDRIVYGTGRHAPGAELETAASEIFDAFPAVRYVHLRSSTNNCYQGRIDRGAG